MFEFWYSADLTVVHPSIDPEVLTRSLGLKPRLQTKAGEDRLSVRGEPLGRKALRSSWICKLHDEEKVDSRLIPLNTLIESWVQKIAPNADLLKTVRDGGGDVHFSIGWYADYANSPYTTGVLEAATLKKCGELGVDIVLSVIVKETSGTETTD